MHQRCIVVHSMPRSLLTEARTPSTGPSCKLHALPPKRGVAKGMILLYTFHLHVHTHKDHHLSCWSKNVYIHQQFPSFNYDYPCMMQKWYPRRNAFNVAIIWTNGTICIDHLNKHSCSNGLIDHLYCFCKRHDTPFNLAVTRTVTNKRMRTITNAAGVRAC